MQSQNNIFEHIFFNLEEYMFTSKKIASLVNLNETDIVIEKKRNEAIKDTTVYIPNNKDKLFWCLFILEYGVEDYELLNKIDFFKIEKKIKIQYIQELRKIKGLLKEKKLKRNLIENDLLNEPIISLSSIEALCVLKNKSIIYIKNKTYSEFNKGHEILGIIIYKDNNYAIKFEYPQNYISYIRNNFLEITNLLKPIKAMTAYNLGEIQELCLKLNINLKDNGVKKNKNKLYNEIKEMLS